MYREEAEYIKTEKMKPEQNLEQLKWNLLVWSNFLYL